MKSKLIALIVTVLASMILSACDNPIRDVVLVPDNGNTCAIEDFGGQCNP